MAGIFSLFSIQLIFSIQPIFDMKASDNHKAVLGNKALVLEKLAISELVGSTFRWKYQPCWKRQRHLFGAGWVLAP